jgi:hypothetical protein
MDYSLFRYQVPAAAWETVKKVGADFFSETDDMEAR